MARSGWRLAGVAGVLLACTVPAMGGEHADPSGFVLTYPKGWVAVTRHTMRHASSTLPDGVRNWLSKNSLVLAQVAVLVVRDGAEEWLENLNIVVDGQQIAADGETARRLSEEMPNQYRAMGARVTDVHAQVEKLGARDVVVVSQRLEMLDVPEPLLQRQVIIPGGGKTYIVTCTAKADSFDAHRPTFDAMLASFRAPPPESRGFNWSRVLFYAAIGGIAGGLFTWVKRTRKRAVATLGSGRQP